MILPSFDDFQELLPWIWIGGGALAVTLIPGLRRSAIWMGALAAVGLGAAIHLGVQDLEGAQPEWPPLLFLDRVRWGVVGAMVVGLLDTVLLIDPSSRRRHLRWIPRVALITWFLWTLPQSPLASEWQTTQERLWLTTVGTSMLLLVFFTESSAQRTKGPLVPLTLTLMCAATSLALLQFRDSSLAHMTGLLAGSLGVATVASFGFRKASLPAGALSIACFSLTAILVASRFYASGDVPPPKLFYLGILLAPITLWLGSRAPTPDEAAKPGKKPPRKPTRLRPILVGWLLAVALIGGALWIAVDAAPVFDH